MRKLFKTILPALIVGLFIGGISLSATILFPSGGGTGIGTYNRGDIIIATTTSQFYKLATGTEGYVLTISSGMPAWVASAGGGAGIDTWNISGATMTATDTVSQITVSLASTTLATTTISTLNLTMLNYASSTNWDSAYGWGDHSLAGYLTSYTESDPKWVASSTDYYNKTQIDASNTAWLVDTDTTYSASGTLLDLTGTNFSVNAGTLTDTKGCIYTAGTGLVCNSTFLTSYSETDPIWQASSTNYYTSAQIDAKGYLTTVDISANTNLAATHPIVLTDDTLSLSTASSSLWQTAYTHSQLTSGNPHSVTKSDVGLANVENTALSSWAGSQNILTVGVIATGTWQGAEIADNYVADNITLTNITQITNRAISDLTGTLAIASTTGTLGIDRGGTNKDMTGWSGLLNITNGVVATTSEADPVWISEKGSYLTSATAASTYLATGTAASTYLTIVNAATNYLATGTAASTYLTITDAGSTYLTITGAATNYVSTTTLANNYYGTSTISTNYLATGTAASTYVARSNWTTIDNYPSDCVNGGMVYGLADALNCYSTSTIRTNLALVVGTNVQAYDANNATTGSNVASATALANNPSDCAAGTTARSIDASGNLTCSVVDISTDTNLAAGRSLTMSGDSIEADVELLTDTKCIWWENPVATDDFKSIWRAKGFAATITVLWGESDQTVVFNLQVDDGTPADVNSTDLTATAGEVEDTTLDGDTTMADGDRLDVKITSVSNTPTWVSICWTYTKDD